MFSRASLAWPFAIASVFWKVLCYQLFCKAWPCGEISVVDCCNKCAWDWAENGAVIIHCEIWLRGHGESVIC